MVLACYFIDKGLNASNAMARVRRLRPGSIETKEQEDAVVQFHREKESGT
jgi:atypical dual specificity phosphatase